MTDSNKPDYLTEWGRKVIDKSKMPEDIKVALKDSNTLKEHEKDCDMCQSIIPSRMNERLIKAIDRDELKDSNKEKGLSGLAKAEEYLLKHIEGYDIPSNHNIILDSIRVGIKSELCEQKKQMIEIVSRICNNGKYKCSAFSDLLKKFDEMTKCSE